jgi:hypothetical protein
MRKLFLMTVMFLSVTLAQAQPGGRPDPKQMLQHQLNGINEAVTLTDEQKVKVKEILQSNFEKMDKMFETMRKSGERPDWEKMRTKMEELRKNETKAIKAILSKEQLPKYEKYVKEREERMKKGPGGGPW